SRWGQLREDLSSAGPLAQAGGARGREFTCRRSFRWAAARRRPGSLGRSLASRRRRRERSLTPRRREVLRSAAPKRAPLALRPLRRAAPDWWGAENLFLGTLPANSPSRGCSRTLSEGEALTG